MARTIAAALVVPLFLALLNLGNASRASTDAAIQTYAGPAVRIGGGTAHTIVQVDAGSQPVAFGVELTPSALRGLSSKPYVKDLSLDWAYFLQFPQSAPNIGFDHVMINWHPVGHPPEGIYTVPHFDFHFYLTSLRSQLAIAYPHEGSPNMAGVAMPTKALVPAGYIIPPGTQTNKMGLHAVPAAAMEFHGKPFANTLIYGYDTKGKLTFVEPMITRAYLLSHPNFTATVTRPRAYSSPAYYPGRYSVTYDRRKGVYVILFSDLKPWQSSKLAEM